MTGPEFPTTYEFWPTLGFALLWVVGATATVVVIHAAHPHLGRFLLALAWVLYPIAFGLYILNIYASWFEELDDL